MTGELLTVPASVYHADEVADVPTLSASIAKILVAQSPRHAYTAHPKLNPAYTRKEDDKFRLGNAVHALFLEGRNAVGVVAAKKWDTKDAKAMRDAILAEGRIPMLNHQWAEVEAMCAAIREQLPTLDVDPPMFQAGKPEQTLVWEEGGVTCRALIDWLHDDHLYIDDLKSTGASGNPEHWQKTMYGFDGDIQVAFHARGCKALFGIEPEFRFLVAETEPPYQLSVVGLLPGALALANDRVTYAINKWRECMATGEWPGYPKRVCYVDAPSYVEYAWMEREAREVAA